MNWAGYVLVGGASSRMGTPKALLPFRGATLVQHVAAVVADAAGAASLVGDPALYGRLGYPVLPDRFPGTGPLGGIVSALAASRAPWSLVLACDMPGISAAFLTRLIALAGHSTADCLVPAGPSGRPEPLCAAYHRRCLPALERAFAAGVRKIMQALAGVAVETVPVEDAGVFQNCNTPGEWAAYNRKTSEGGV